MKLLFAALAFSIVGCAQPRYESVTQAPAPGSLPNGTQEKAGTCAVKLRMSLRCLSWQWEKLPTSSAAGSLVFKIARGNLYDDSLVPVDVEPQPQVVLWMPSMGHGSSPTKVERLDVGTYRASSVFFVMPGDWEIRFQVKEGETVSDEAIVALSI